MVILGLINNSEEFLFHCLKNGPRAGAEGSIINERAPQDWVDLFVTSDNYLSAATPLLTGDIINIYVQFLYLAYVCDVHLSCDFFLL